MAKVAVRQRQSTILVESRGEAAQVLCHVFFRVFLCVFPGIDGRRFMDFSMNSLQRASLLPALLDKLNALEQGELSVTCCGMSSLVALPLFL